MTINFQFHRPNFAYSKIKLGKAVGQLEKVPELKSLDEKNIITLKNVLRKNFMDATVFLSVISGFKPSAMITSYYGPLDFLKQTGKFDFLHDKKFFDQTFILNKKQVLSIIEKNKSIFTTRLNVPEDTSVEKIYPYLKKELFNTKYHDLIGMALGFPKIDSMIFQLEMLSGTTPEMRKHKQSLKHKLLHTLYSENSIYKNLDKKTFSELDYAIRNMHRIKKSPFKSYVYIQYTKPSENTSGIALKEKAFFNLLP